MSLVYGAHIPLKTGPNANETKKKEMYMANANILHWVLNATYIPLTGIGVWRWG